MKNLLQISSIFTILFLLSSFFNPIFSQAIEPVGGPYTVDANTLMLLHFDSNLLNASTLSANGVGHGTYNFLTSPLGTGMGQCIRLKNDALSDSTYISVADTANLDLTGDWTIEGWINVFTFGTTSNDHRWVPRLCIKPGDEIFWRPNWWVELWGDNRWFQTGFHTADGNNWPAITSKPNIMQPGAWFHLTFIRDNTRKILIQLIHDGTPQRNLIYYGSFSYANLPVQTPMVNSKPVCMGWGGPGSVDSWLDGFLDEVRISNKVRNFAIPPVITNVTVLSNQPDPVTSYLVNADIQPFNQGATISNAELRYSTDKGLNWQTINMTKNGNQYSGSIPKQTFGSIIRYYVYAKDNNNLAATYPPEAPTNYLQFAVYKAKTQTLFLDFEEGPGIVPKDKSPYNNPITNYVPVNYSNDRKFGNWSFYSTYSASATDSNYLEVNSPFLSNNTFSVDTWIKADSLHHGCRIIHLPKEISYNDNNFSLEIRKNPPTSQKLVFGGRYWSDAVTPNVMVTLLTDTAAEKNKWFHLIFERNDSVAIFQLRNENDLLIQEKRLDTAYVFPPVLGNKPLRIGRGYNTQSDPWFIPPFFGKIDNLKIYNYAAVLLTGVNDKLNIPHEFRLEQNYPNPFNPSTIIKYSLSKSEKITLAVFDILGRKVKTLVDEVIHAGENSIVWNGKNDEGKNVASGVYFYSLITNEITLNRKMILIK